MTRIYQLICGLMVLVLLSAGGISLFDQDAAFSDTEGRNLKAFPQITVVNLIDGTFLRELEMYYADTFPGRENMLEFFQTLESLSGLDVQLAGRE